MPLKKVKEAIEDIRNGKMVILVDDEDRENEGDLVMAAELVTPEAINFMAKYGRGRRRPTSSSSLSWSGKTPRRSGQPLLFP